MDPPLDPRCKQLKQAIEDWKQIKKLITDLVQDIRNYPDSYRPKLPIISTACLPCNGVIGMGQLLLQLQLHLLLHENSNYQVARARMCKMHIRVVEMSVVQSWAPQFFRCACLGEFARRQLVVAEESVPVDVQNMTTDDRFEAGKYLLLQELMWHDRELFPGLDKLFEKAMRKSTHPAAHLPPAAKHPTFYKTALHNHDPTAEPELRALPIGAIIYPHNSQDLSNFLTDAIKSVAAPNETNQTDGQGTTSLQGPSGSQEEEIRFKAVQRARRELAAGVQRLKLKQ